MATEITFTVDDEIFAKLETALDLNNESLDDALDYCARSFVAKASPSCERCWDR